MSKKKKPDTIKDAPDDIMSDISLQNNIIEHINAFGFTHVIDNVIEAYRRRARRFNKMAEELEKQFKRSRINKMAEELEKQFKRARK